MMLRRKACQTCVRGKRKCDLELPSCKRCRRLGKECRYGDSPNSTNAPHCLSDDRSLRVTKSIKQDIAKSTKQDIAKPPKQDVTKFTKQDFAEFIKQNVPKPKIPNFLGPLGEIRPIIGQNQSWDWLIEQLKSYPIQFSRSLDAIFIHKGHGSVFQSTLRTAFGICGAHAASLNMSNREPLWRIIDAEVVDLLNSVSSNTLLEDLAKLQALTLYQIIRLLHGGFDERIVAEDQWKQVAVLGVNLLRRTNTELGTVQPTFEQWLTAETVRRTVMAAFLLYCVHFLNHIGSCPFYSTLKRIPVSSRPELWQTDGSEFLPLQDITMTYVDYGMAWAAAPQRKLNSFERMILVPCKGLEQIKLYNGEAV